MTTAHYVEVYRAADGYRWRRRAGNHEIVAESGEAYTEHTYALEMATSLNPGVPLVDLEDGPR
jgi:uncharacterized protein YegP (UPF0339 family)